MGGRVVLWIVSWGLEGSTGTAGGSRAGRVVGGFWEEAQRTASAVSRRANATPPQVKYKRFGGVRGRASSMDFWSLNAFLKFGSSLVQRCANEIAWVRSLVLPETF